MIQSLAEEVMHEKATEEEVRVEGHANQELKSLSHTLVDNAILRHLADRSIPPPPSPSLPSPSPPLSHSSPPSRTLYFALSLFSVCLSLSASLFPPLSLPSFPPSPHSSLYYALSSSLLPFPVLSKNMFLC